MDKPSERLLADATSPLYWAEVELAPVVPVARPGVAWAMR